MRGVLIRQLCTLNGSCAAESSRNWTGAALRNKNIFALTASWCRSITYSTKQRDNKHYMYADNQKISPWFDIPLIASPQVKTQVADPIKCRLSELRFNYVNEIPKHTTAKMEMDKEEEFNPLVCDKKKDGSPRHLLYRGGVPYNYGFLPQTWEDPRLVHPLTDLIGDSDPIDAIEISPSPLPIGAVREVQVIGAVCLIDQEETDWKILVIDAEKSIDGDVVDVDMDLILDWYKNYKTIEGKGVNEWGLDGEMLSQLESIEVVKHYHDLWINLLESAIKSGAPASAPLYKFPTVLPDEDDQQIIIPSAHQKKPH